MFANNKLRLPVKCWVTYFIYFCIPGASLVSAVSCYIVTHNFHEIRCLQCSAVTRYCRTDTKVLKLKQ